MLTFFFFFFFSLGFEDDTQIIFRANSLATKATEQYMRNLCSEYIQQVLSGPIKQVLSSKYSCEIDDSRLSEGEDVQRNAKRLMGHIKTFLDSIFSSVEQCPKFASFSHFPWCLPPFNEFPLFSAVSSAVCCTSSRRR